MTCPPIFRGGLTAGPVLSQRLCIDSAISNGESSALDHHVYKTDIFREGSGKASNVNNFRLEGVPFHDSDGPENMLNLIEHQVTVRDVRLTVEVGEGARYPRLCYINMSRID